jgi:hypothetical protein
VWVITSLLEIEHNCGRKGGLFNCLRIVETKACLSFLSHPYRVTGRSVMPMPGLAEC